MHLKNAVLKGMGGNKQIIRRRGNPLPHSYKTYVADERSYGKPHKLPEPNRFFIAITPRFFVILYSP